MKEFIKVTKALSDTNRVKIVKMLQHRSMCVCELQEGLGISQCNVSRHLKVLEKAGLVYSAKDGLWVNYFIDDGNNNPYAGVILGNLKHWLKEDDSISELIIRLPLIQREEICRK